MNEHEFLRIIEFIDGTRAPFAAQIAGMSPDSDWALTSYLIRAKLLQQAVSISQLIAASGLPYGTAHRRINILIDEGLIDIAPSSPTGKSRVLLPSQALMQGFEALALQVKSLVATLVGQRDESQNSEQYYFGEPRNRCSNWFRRPTFSNQEAATESDCGSCFTTTTIFRRCAISGSISAPTPAEAKISNWRTCRICTRRHSPTVPGTNPSSTSSR